MSNFNPRALLLALAFTLAPLAAHAATVATIENQAGGTINLTDEKCLNDPASRFVYSRDAGGRIVLTGCWMFDGDFVFVKWDDGTVYSYPGGSVTMRVAAKPKGVQL